jgi:hypothetical protein
MRGRMRAPEEKSIIPWVNRESLLKLLVMENV